MFSKSSVLTLVALAAFLSLGAVLLPQVVQAQCVWDCDLGGGGSLPPWGNSPQSQLDIAYCLDRDCVANLKDKNGNLIFPGNAIPVPLVQQDTFSCPPAGGTSGAVTISGNVVALLRDNQGNLLPQSAAQASLSLTILNVQCSADPLNTGKTILSRVVGVNELRTTVFGPSSSITILKPTSSTPLSLSTPIGWTGCPSNKKTGILTDNCPFPLGIVELTANQLQNEFPATPSFPTVGEVYRAVEQTRFVGVRDCKGDANSTDPNTIACSTGGGESLALFTFPGNWAGATNHTINQNSGNTPFDIFAPNFLNAILDQAAGITATADNGPQVPTTGCFIQANQQTVRCFFTAKDLLPNGCTKGLPVIVLVTGNLTGQTVGFESHDNPTCAKQ